VSHGVALAAPSVALAAPSVCAIRLFAGDHDFAVVITQQSHDHGLRGLPIGPWAGLGVLAAWAAAALLAGALVLCLRDA
jgi:hypothetical protein